jgi:hypothetical protein
MRTQSHWNFTIHSPFQRTVFQVKNFLSLERSPPRPCLWQIHLKDNKALNWENCHIQRLLHNQSLLGYCLKAYLYTLVRKHHVQTLVLVVEANPEKNIQTKEWKQNKWFTPITDKMTIQDCLKKASSFWSLNFWYTHAYPSKGKHPHLSNVCS